METKNSLWLLVRVAVLIALGLLVHKVTAAEPPSPPPLVYLIALDPDAAEAGADEATFIVLRIGATNDSLNVLYQVAGTAANGSDYQTLPGSITIPPGAYFAELTVTPIDDTLVEGSETVLLGLDHPLVWPPPYIVAWPSIALGVIEDDDVAPTNSPPHVALVNPPDGSVFMAPADIKLVARAADRDGRVHHVEFFEGTNSLGMVTKQPRLIARAELLVASADLIAEIAPDEFPDFSLAPASIDPTVIPGHLFRLLWEDVRPGHYVLTAVATDNDGASTRSEPVEIRVTEPPPQPVVNIIAVDPVAAEDPSPTDPADVINTATFAVRRSGNTNIPLTVFYRVSGTASNGVDYESLPHSVTIPAGARGARVVVVPIDDNLVEGRESVVLTLVDPICIATFPPPPDCYIVGRYDAARAVIRDNDFQPSNRPPVVQIVRPLDGSVFIAPADIAIVAQARDFDGRVVSVEFFEGTNSLGIVSNNLSAITANRPPFFLVWSNVPPGHYVLSAEATDNDGATSPSRPVEIKVVERTIPPTVNIVATDPEASEQGGLSNASSPTGAVNTATFTVSRTGPTTDALRVHYSLYGSASNGVDYRKLTGELLIPSGAASADIVVHPFDDHLVEGTEQVIASIDLSRCLSISSALRDCYIVGTYGRALAAIRDNDVSPSNQPPKVAIVRPESGDVFIAPADITLVAEAKDADGFVRSVEFFANGTSLGIVSNDNSVVINDVLSADDFFRLKWSNVLAGDYVLTARATDNRGAMTTSDPIRIRVVFPEPPVVTIEARDPYASEGGLHAASPNSIGVTPVPVSDTATFVVSRSHGTNEPLTVHYRLSGSSSNGVDYRELSGEVTIPRGAWRAEIVVDPIDDNLAEHTETVVATLAPVLCAHVIPVPPGCYQVGDPHRAVAYIRDNDINRLPRVEIVAPTDGDVFPALSDIEIDVLARDSDGYVWRVEFFAGTNKIGEDLRLFFVPPPPGQLQKFSMIWSNVPAGEYKLWAKATDDRDGMTISDGVKIFVVDRTRVPVVTIETVDKVATEQSPLVDSVPDTGLFVVTRTGETNRPLVVYYNAGGSALNGVDYRRLSGEVTIPSGETSARIILETLDDNLVERTETVVLTLEKPDCPDVNALSPTPVLRGCYLVGKPARAIAYIRDNDSPPNEGPHIAILMPDEGETFEAPADIEILAVGLDPDGWITQIEFYEGTNQIGGFAILVAESPPPGELQTFQFNWDDVPPGNYTLTARATDNSGESTVSGPIHIRVFDPCHVPVVTIAATDPVASEPRQNQLRRLSNSSVFTVRRNCGFDRPLLVHYRVTGTASINGVDYVALTGEVLFQAGDSAARIIVNPLDDNLAEGTERVVVELVQRPCIAVDPSPADCYLVGRPNRAVVYIRDNDGHAPRIAITSPHNGAVFHAPADIPVMAQALDPDGWVTQVEFFANSNLIGVATVNFLVEPPPGQLQKFDIRWLDVAAGHYVLTARATDNTGDTAWSERVEIKVVPPPTVPTVTIVARDPYATEGGTNTATFRVRRDCCGTGALTVWYAITGSASNGVDYASLSGFVTIPAGARSAPIVVTPVDDRVPEAIETVVLELQQPPTGSPILTYHIGRPEAAAAIIVDNDQPLPVSQRLVDGLVHLCVPAVDGVCYRIEATSDFVNWEVLCRNTARGDALHFVEPRGRELTRRFYRVVPDICDEEE